MLQRGSFLVVAWLLVACEAAPESWSWDLPEAFPAPAVPADNPMSRAKVELGRHLFYDPRLSRNGTQSCASCHEQARAFSDGRTVAIGSTGEQHRRNSPGLANVAWVATLTWANPLVETLERQALLPLLGETPVELGWSGAEEELLERLRADAEVVRRFAAAFGDEPISLQTITRALAAFQRTIISSRSPYDRWVAGDSTALSESAKRGLALFNTERLECYHCHAGFTFSDSVRHAQTQLVERPFHNTGLYDVDGLGAYPAADPGLVEISQQPRDRGRFRTPTLRNLSFTAPYMHDGSLATLDDVIDAYAAGGRHRQLTGVVNPLQSNFVRGFTLTAEERADLLAFLRALDDEALLTDERLSDPFR